MLQLSLLDPNPASIRPPTVGPADVRYADVANILTRPTGRLDMLDFALNPYQGCTFACTYCYAAFFVADDQDRDDWGRWVRVKTNALQQLRRTRHDLRDKTVLMSSATDPYQPIEAKLRLTRSLLPILARRGARLTVQTRSPLVVRDIDLLQRFDHVRVNLSVTTDNDDTRKLFEPGCASIDQRIDAVAQLADSGIYTGVSVSPMLPLDDPATFARRLAGTGAQSIWVSTFHPNTTRPFAAGTRQPALKLARQLGFSEERRKTQAAQLRHYLNAQLRANGPKAA